MVKLLKKEAEAIDFYKKRTINDIIENMKEPLYKYYLLHLIDNNLLKPEDLVSVVSHKDFLDYIYPYLTNKSNIIKILYTKNPEFLSRVYNNPMNIFENSHDYIITFKDNPELLCKMIIDKALIAEKIKAQIAKKDCLSISISDLNSLFDRKDKNIWDFVVKNNKQAKKIFDLDCLKQINPLMEKVVL